MKMSMKISAILILFLISFKLSFSQNESDEKFKQRMDRLHKVNKGEKDTLIRVVIICTKLPNQEDAPKNEIRVEGWVKKDLATYSDPKSVIDFYDMNMRRIPKEYVNRYQEK